MSEKAAKQSDKIISDSPQSQVWVQPPGSPPPTPISVNFSYEGLISQDLSQNVRAMGLFMAVVSSTATNSVPPASQTPVTSQGSLLTTTVNHTGSIAQGSSSVFINGKSAARHNDPAKTWDYGTPSSPGIAKEIVNAKVSVEQNCNVFIGG